MISVVSLVDPITFPTPQPFVAFSVPPSQPPNLMHLLLHTIASIRTPQHTKHHYELHTHSMSRGFNVAHQKVSLDVDLGEKVLRGQTEITIVPSDLSIRQFRFDCRQAQIKQVLVNGKKATFTHHDASGYEAFSDSRTVSDVHQHHLYRKYIDHAHKEVLEGELEVNLPRGVKVSYQDTSRETGPAADEEAVGVYAPLIVTISFVVRDPRTGVSFVGGHGSRLKKSFWHAYTTHAPIGAATSHWLPCVDGLWSRCTWQFEITVPRTVGALGGARVEAEEEVEEAEEAEEDVDMEEGETPRVKEEEEQQQQEQQEQEQHIDTVAESPKTPKDEEDAAEDPAEDLEPDLEIEIEVVGNGAAVVEELPHAEATKKTIAYSLWNPVSAQHIGFAVGPFVEAPLPDFRDTDEDEDGGTPAGFPIKVFSLPDQVSDASNTCVFLHKAIEFLTNEYGSFPFDAMSVVFVSEFGKAQMGASGGLCVASDDFLYPPDVVDPLLSSTEALTVALTTQWCGVNIVPRTWNDTWLTQGLAIYMAALFMKRLMGNNEYRYRFKRLAETICDEDVGRPPLAKPHFRFPLFPKDLSFINLKAPGVLFILDRRMTKIDKTFGLSRVIPRIFLQSLSGDLVNNALGTNHFYKLCERVSHCKLDEFFDQWVYSCGVPVLQVTQRFNKKRMFIEMGIRQTQTDKSGEKQPVEETFIGDVIRSEKAGEEEEGEGEEGGGPKTTPLFTGPITIRIHEADGTPYEHVVDIKHIFTKLDIQYNTKYKRLKRNKKEVEAANAAAAVANNSNSTGNSNSTNTTGNTGNEEDEVGVVISCLGDVLQTDAELEEWQLSEWGKDEEMRMSNEAFEWLRIDADFEWICKIHVNQPDYMYASQLQQDRDVVAQYESVQFFADSRPSKVYSTILLRTLIDRRYYYGVRVAAALGLVKMAVSETSYIGQTHLLKAFQSLFCFPNSSIPRSNDFSDFPTYFVQKAITRAFSQIRNTDAECPQEIRALILDILAYNENSTNSMSDSFYLADLITFLADVLCSSDSNDESTREFAAKAVNEIDRCGRLDTWIPSYQNVVTVAALEAKKRLFLKGLFAAKLQDLIQFTRSVNSSEVRLAAFEAMLHIGGLRNHYIMHYVFASAALDDSARVRNGIIELFTRYLGTLAIKGDMSADTGSFGDDNDGMIVDDGTQAAMEARKVQMARTSLLGAADILRDMLRQDAPLQTELWGSLRSPYHGLEAKTQLLDVCQVLFVPVDAFKVKLATPSLVKLGVDYSAGSSVAFRVESNIPAPERTAVLPAIKSKRLKEQAQKSEIVVVSKHNPKVRYSVRPGFKITTNPRPKKTEVKRLSVKLSFK